MNEFEIIEHFFNRNWPPHPHVSLGIGDDGAIVTLPKEEELVLTIDTLVEGTHFLKNTVPEDIGYKSLAVNLSDLAAMGATPAWFLLSLTLPSRDLAWLKAFSEGCLSLAEEHRIALIGGDLTRGPLSITIQAAGTVPIQSAIKRSTAKPGDRIYVTHTIGDAALGLAILKNTIQVPTQFQNDLLSRLNRPTPRTAIGQAIRPFATAAIDISDGLAADLSHILEKSQCGATVCVDWLPFSIGLLESVPMEKAIELGLTGGDDYELCFTVPADQTNPVGDNCTCIGEIIAEPGLRLQWSSGEKYELDEKGYRHF